MLLASSRVCLLECQEPPDAVQQNWWAVWPNTSNMPNAGPELCLLLRSPYLWQVREDNIVSHNPARSSSDNIPS